MGHVARKCEPIVVRAPSGVKDDVVHDPQLSPRVGPTGALKCPPRRKALTRTDETSSFAPEGPLTAEIGRGGSRRRTAATALRAHPAQGQGEHPAAVDVAEQVQPLLPRRGERHLAVDAE